MRGNVLASIYRGDLGSEASEAQAKKEIELCDAILEAECSS